MMKRYLLYALLLFAALTAPLSAAAQTAGSQTPAKFEKEVVKTLRADALAPQARAADLAREAQTLARLSHPNIVTVFDGGEIDGVPFLCMEYVEGAHLGELVRGRKPPLQALVRILMAVPPRARVGPLWAGCSGCFPRGRAPKPT